MPRYIVVTPEYEVFGQTEIEPAEYGCDVIEVEAPTKREAIKIGVKLMLADQSREHGARKYGWCKDQRSDGRCPYTGIKAFDYEPEPEEEHATHG